MSDIFLSYATEDRPRARLVAEVLEAQGWTVFWDRKTPPGKSWKKYIADELKEARCVVVLWSSASVDSEWVDEEAHEGKLHLVPVLLEDVRPPFGFRQIQAASLIDWKGGAEHPEIRNLLGSVAEYVGKREHRAFPPPADAVAQPEERPSRKRGPVIPEWHGIGLSADGAPHIEWVEIPAGPFLYGDDKREIAIPAFRIAQFPITNGQYDAFAKAGGYTVQEKACWSADGWKWKKRRSEPDDDMDDVFREFDHPRVKVSWFEAEAFCSWLGGKLGHEVSLPTEQQWEKAARGTEGRIYPWGDVFEANRCNFENYHTTPVNRFPSGVSPYGVMDLSGNVWEWTKSPWDVSGSLVLRGGSFRNKEPSLRCANRSSLRPGGVDARGRPRRRLRLGFRVCAPVL